MSEFLFDVPQVDSPRLAWMKKHKLWARQNVVLNDLWRCIQEGGRTVDGEGTTEDEAITDWAIQNDVRLWNEEAT